MPRLKIFRLALLCIAFLTIFAVPGSLLAADTADTTDTADTADTASSSPLTHRLVQEGVAMTLALEPLDGGEVLREGANIRVRLEIEDTHTGAPRTTLYPAAWMNRLPEGLKDDSAACKKKVEGFLSGSILSVPELDLNVYYVLALNDNATISVVDPLFGFGGSKLLDMVFLESPGEDWAMTADQKRLFVSMPRSGKVAVVDTTDWTVIHNIEVGPLPARLELQDDGRYLWVAFEGKADAAGRSGVSVIDTRELRETTRLLTGRGRHDLVLDDRARFAYVSNLKDATVSVIDVRALEVAGQVEVGGAPVSLGYSRLDAAAWAVDARGAVVAIDGEKLEVAARLVTEPGIARIRFTPDGRFGFVPNPISNELHIVDAATRQIPQNGEMEEGPDDVFFSDTLAYVRHRGSDLLLMIPLDEIGTPGAPIPVIDVPGGKHPSGDTPMPSSAATIVQAPGANAVLVANPQDEAIYFYKEGMAAPMGHFQNYGRQPRAVEVVDRSLREQQPGIYETTTRMLEPGRYDVAVFVDSPRVVECFPVVVEADPAYRRSLDPRKVHVAINANLGKPAVGETVEVVVSVRDAKTGAPREGLKDVDVVAFLAPGIWQSRQWARELGEGRYAVELVPPEEGVYYVFVEISSEGLRSNQSGSIILEAVPVKAEVAANNLKK